jgi:hypothetical protein
MIEKIINIKFTKEEYYIYIEILNVAIKIKFKVKSEKFRDGGLR